MAVSRATNPQLYTPIYDKFLIEGYKAVPQVFPQIFTVLSDDSKEYKTDMLGGLGTWVSVDELGETPSEDLNQLWPKTFTHIKFGKSVIVSYEGVDDDEYAILSKANVVKAEGRGAARKADQDAADIINNSFTSTQTPDSQWLCDTDHPYSPTDATTLSNKITTALTPAALDEMEIKIANNGKDSTGEVVDIEPTTLLVPAALYGTAMEICDKRAWNLRGTADRVLNRFAGVYNVLMWRRLTTSTTAWWLVVPKQDYGLKFVWRERPHYDAWVNHTIDAYDFKGRMRYSLGADDWRCIWGSTGAG